jgi:hypothetical protein
MTAPSDITHEQLEQALMRYQGSMTSCIAELKISHTTFYRLLDQHDLREFMEEQRESLVEYSTSVIRDAIVEPGVDANLRFNAAKWWLNNSPAGKRKGYGPRQELTGKEGEPVEIKADIPERSKDYKEWKKDHEK